MGLLVLKYNARNSKHEKKYQKINLKKWVILFKIGVDREIL